MQYDERLAALDVDFKPRAKTLLYDWAEDLQLSSSRTVLDLGCGRGVQAVELARRFGVQVFAVDPVQQHIKSTQQLAAEAHLTHQVSVLKGYMEAIPVADHAIDVIWCHDVLSHASDVHCVFDECERVLRPGGRVLLNAPFATDWLEPGEAERWCKLLCTNPDSLRLQNVENAILQAGFIVTRSEVIGSEFAEYVELKDGRCTRSLMRLARLLRHRERFVDEWGQELVNAAIGMYQWYIFQLLGKISFHQLLLEKRA